jgi:hypothetical protein
MKLDTSLKAVWRREQGLRLSEGALVFLRWSVLLFVASVILDWFVDIPAWGRLVLLGVVVVVPFVQAWRAGWRLVRPFNPAHTALQIEKQLGGLESLLVSAVQLRGTQAGVGASEALSERVLKQAEVTVSGLKLDTVVRLQSLRRPAVLAVAVVLFLSVLSLNYGTLLSAGAGRIFTPWLAIDYPTRTHLEIPKGALVVQEGAPAKISARVTGVIPRQAKIALRTGKGAARVRTIDIVKGTCGYTIDTAFRSFEYRLMAGDARSAWYEVKVISAPVIERVAVKLEYPAYTGRPAETVEALTLTVPETTKISWTLKLDQAVKVAKLNLPDEKSIPMEISADGRTVSFKQAATESLAYGFTWVEKEHGFSYASPSHYLQVAPDQPPTVELTAPHGNIYATLGRKLDLAFRGRDDHGIAESVIAYRVDKTEETKVPFKPAVPVEGQEQLIDWDYRSVLTNLAVGQTISFAVELADRYPPPGGPHRVRSEARRMQFMSKRDYLAQIEKQKKRLLSQLRTIYREEREVYEVVLRLDPADPVFVQTCQLEAVRQDLMRERLKALAGQMLDLTDDLAANSITNAALTASLVNLRSELVIVSTGHVAEAASALRELAGESSSKVSEGGKGGRSESLKVQAQNMVNSSARELGLLVLQLGYQDAADVMARELHGTAQTQASLRLRTIMLTGGNADLALEQERLGKWLTRLLKASPRERESTIDEALIEFTLTRLVKQMINGGIEQRLQKASVLVREGGSAEAARLQTEVIQALLKAEFRLRVGSEREALAIARDLFLLQADGQKKLRVEIKELDAQVFKKRSAEFARAQTKLHRNLQMLLMPEIPARRTRLFDAVFPAPPPVADLLGAADDALTKAASHIAAGDRDAAEKAQSKAEESFAELADMATKRIAALTQQIRIDRLNYGAQEIAKRLGRFAEVQLSILERTEDAAAKKAKSEYLGDEEQALAESVDELRLEVVDQVNTAAMPSEYSVSLPVCIEEAVQSMKQAIPLLKDNKPGEAVACENAAVAALAGARAMLAEHGTNLAAYAAIVGSTDKAVAPSRYVGEIEEEQRDMLEVTRKTKPENFPGLAIPQKNLIHAIGAVVISLDPIAHMVESGTVMVFAKDDMDSAGTALEKKDQVEALDAQAFVVETLGKLRGKVDKVIPQFRYVLEVVEALHETAQEGVLIREAQRRLRLKTLAAADTVALAKEQGTLKSRADAFWKLINKITGLGLIDACAGYMAEAESALKGGDKSAAAAKMALAEQALKTDAAEISRLMTLLPALLGPPAPGQKDPEQVVLLKQVVAMAASQKVLYRESCAAKPDQLAGFEPKLHELEKACDPFIKLAQTHVNPVVAAKVVMPKKGEPVAVPTPPKPIPPANLHLKLVAAKDELSKAAANAKASDRVKAVAGQDKAADTLRHFIVEYTLKFLKTAAGVSGGDTVPSIDFIEIDHEMMLFMPGAVSGKRPPDGKLEWEVLGRRERAALNENFARELPLEYRAILKDYYERLAK